MRYWAILKPDGRAAAQICSDDKPEYDGGWQLVRREHVWRREGPGGEYFCTTTDDQTMADIGENPHFLWKHYQTVFHWRAQTDEGGEFFASSAPDNEPPLQNGMYRCVALERFADFTLESVSSDGTISADLDKHKAQAIHKIESKAAPALQSSEPAWKQAQHEAKRQEVHFWSSGRRSSLSENFPLAWAEVRRKYPSASLMDTDHVGEVIGTYRAAMQADLERTAPVEAWRVTSKDAVRQAITVEAVAAAIDSAMKDFPA